MSKAIIRNGKIMYDTDAGVVKPSLTAARESREVQRSKYRSEMLQPNQVGYYKVNPKQAENLSDETRRLLS